MINPHIPAVEIRTRKRLSESTAATGTRAESDPVRVLIIETNGMKAELLEYVCSSHWRFAVVGVEKSGRSGIAATFCHQPEVVLATLVPAELSAPDFIAELRQAATQAKLIFFATQYNEFLLHLLRTSPYDGLIYEPEESLDSISRAIEAVRRGTRFTSRRIAECQNSLRFAPGAFPKILTSREQEVLVCIAHSMSDPEIGDVLGCSSATALCHRRRVMRKLGIHSTPKLIRYCTEKGFNSVPPFQLATPRTGKPV